jgi:hypothetical protein
VKLLAAAGAAVGSFDSAKIRSFLLDLQDWSGWTGTVGFDSTTGNRIPAPVVVVSTRADGTLHVDSSWAASTGFGSDDDSAKGTQLRAEMSLSSDFSLLQKVGVEESQTYGWNQLVGKTNSNLGDFDVVMLGNVDYINGSGPFFGFITMTASNGDVLAMRMDGTARLEDDGVTSLSSSVTVIGGTGDYISASGTGNFTGKRIAEVGAPIEFTLIAGITGL